MSFKEVVILYTPFVILLMLFIGAVAGLILSFKEGLWKNDNLELTKDKISEKYNKNKY